MTMTRWIAVALSALTIPGCAHRTPEPMTPPFDQPPSMPRPPQPPECRPGDPCPEPMPIPEWRQDE
jgi:hypothetical protein